MIQWSYLAPINRLLILLPLIHVLLIFVCSKGDAMSTSEMRQAVTEYVKTNNLQKESDRQ